MTTLSDPAQISQLSEGALGWNVCGEAACWSAIQAFGQAPSLTAVTQAALQEGAAGNGETSAAVLVAVLAGYGVAAAWGWAPLPQSIPTALGRRHRIIVLVSSDSDGNPKAGTGIGHWITAYGDDGGTYAVLNTLGSPPGQLHAYSQALLQSCDLGQYVEIGAVAPADAPTPTPTPPPPPPQETEMIVVFTAALVKNADGTPAAGASADFVAWGCMFFRWIPNPTAYGDIVNNTGPAFNGGQPVKTWNVPQDVADIAAFGLPADQISATMLGLPFP
jgi:hypothetical protein